MTSISKNVYIDKLNGIVNKYITTYYRTIKMKPDIFLEKAVLQISQKNLL